MKWQPVLFAIGNNPLRRFRGIASGALAIDDAGRRARFTIQGFPALHIESAINAIQRAAPVLIIHAPSRMPMDRPWGRVENAVATQAQALRLRLTRILPSLIQAGSDT